LKLNPQKFGVSRNFSGRNIMVKKFLATFRGVLKVNVFIMIFNHAKMIAPHLPSLLGTKNFSQGVGDKGTIVNESK
jgi:hypothetical protein